MHHRTSAVDHLAIVVSTPPAERTAAPAVTMAAAVLDFLATTNPSPVGPSEIGRRLGIAKSSVANVCTTLARANLVRREGTGYVLGQRLAELGATYLDGVDEVRLFHKICSEYLPAPQETIQLAAMGAGLDVAHLARRDGTVLIQMVTDVGRHLPATCTATGKALLAAMPDDEIDRRLKGATLPRFTANSITDVQMLWDDLERIRRRGWAVDDQELLEGVLCLGAAVPRSRTAPGYAVSFTLLRAWATRDHCERLGNQLVEVGALISDRLGHGSKTTL